jgi:hypothetical protein
MQESGDNAHLLPLDDPRWSSYRDGFNRRHYDSITLIRHLQASGTTQWFWDQLWGQLHHQGNIGEASYAVIPYLVEHARHAQKLDAQVVAFACVVEGGRLNALERGNPVVPDELERSYDAAIRHLPLIALSKAPDTWDQHLVQYTASLIALTHGQPILAQAYEDLTVDEAMKWLDS